MSQDKSTPASPPQTPQTPGSPGSLPPSTAARADAETEGERALAELAEPLGALDEGAVVRPSTDPHAAAATALLVSDYLGQPELRETLASAGMTAASVHELRGLSRAIIAVVERLGGDYLPDAPGIPGDLVQRGQSVRTALSTAIEKALPDDPDVLTWLEAIRLGAGAVDLVYDLRTLAEFCGQRSELQGEAGITEETVHAAVAAADAIEFALRTGDTPESTQSRNTLARLWTLFVPAYDRAAAAGRVLTRGEGKERQFPPLALVASHRRARRRPLSVLPSHGIGPAARRSVTPVRSRPPSVAPTALSAAQGLASIPAAPALPDFGDVKLIEADDVAPPLEVVRSEPPPAASGSPSGSPAAATPDERANWSDTRRANRQPIEIEVGIASESNFYLGFTENLSNGGVFVATYVTRPIGASVEVSLAFPNGEELRVPGVVRWLRDATADGWPGMGVQFESLSPDDEAKVRKFLSLREPMFYDE